MVQMGANPDHHGAKLHTRYPGEPIRVHKPSRVDPVPIFASAAVKTLTTQLLKDLYEEIETADHTTSASRWEAIKGEIARRT